MVSLHDHGVLHDADFIINMLPKLHWEALREGAAALGLPELPPESEVRTSQGRRSRHSCERPLLH